jgi:hypothetical protein
MLRTMEESCESVQDNLDRAENITDLEKRRAFLREIGPGIGRLDRLMEALDGGNICRELLHREVIVGTIDQFTELYGLKLVEPWPEKSAPPAS